MQSHRSRQLPAWVHLWSGDDQSSAAAHSGDHSVADVELICDVETRFGILISEAEGCEASTMGDLIQLVDRKVKAKYA